MYGRAGDCRHQTADPPLGSRPFDPPGSGVWVHLLISAGRPIGQDTAVFHNPPFPLDGRLRMLERNMLLSNRPAFFATIKV